MASGVVAMNGNDRLSLPIRGQAMCRHYTLVMSAGGRRMLRSSRLSRQRDGGSTRLSHFPKSEVEPSQRYGPSIFTFKGFPSIMESRKAKKLDTRMWKK